MGPDDGGGGGGEGASSASAGRPTGSGARGGGILGGRPLRGVVGGLPAGLEVELRFFDFLERMTQVVDEDYPLALQRRK